jgi:hypothetical protein
VVDSKEDINGVDKTTLTSTWSREHPTLPVPSIRILSRVRLIVRSEEKPSETLWSFRIAAFEPWPDEMVELFRVDFLHDRQCDIANPVNLDSQLLEVCRQAAESGLIRQEQLIKGATHESKCL